MREKTVQFQSEAEQAGFTMVPNVVLMGRLKVTAKVVYGLLVHHARETEECWPGIERLAELAGCSERSVRSAITELKKEGLVEVKRRGLGQSNLYRILPLDPQILPFSPANSAALERREVPGKEKQLKEKQLNETKGLFSYWQAATGRAKTKLTPERSRKLQARLRTYTPEEIRKAIDNVAASDFHMAQGAYAGERQHNDLTLICRTDTKLEEYRDMGSGSDEAIDAAWERLSQRNLAALDEG